jgi:hypothetical protein
MPLSPCLQCVVGHCNAEESLHVVAPGIFAGLLPPDGEVVDNSIQHGGSGSSQAVHNFLPIPPDTQHCLVRMKIRLRTSCCLLVWSQPFLPLLEIDVGAPFFVTSDDARQNRLMLTSKVMTGEQRSTDSDKLVLVVLSLFPFLLSVAI